MSYVPDVMRKRVYDVNENQSVDSAEDADTVDGIHGTELLKRDGSTPMTGDLDMGGNIIRNAGGFIVQPKSFDKGYTWKVPAGYVLTYILPPGGELSGTDTIQGDGDFIGFEL